MLICNEQSKPELIDSLYTPSLSTHFWVLDMDIDEEGTIDYTLAPLVMFQETVCPSLRVLISGFDFYIPASWNILVFDEETSAVDVVEANKLMGKPFTAMVYGPNVSRPTAELIQMIDYDSNRVHIAPVLNKNQMLCHPIRENAWVCIAPTDSYNKYLKDKTIGDII